MGTQPRLSKLVERMTVENDLWKEGVGDTYGTYVDAERISNQEQEPWLYIRYGQGIMVVNIDSIEITLDNNQ